MPVERSERVERLQIVRTIDLVDLRTGELTLRLDPSTNRLLSEDTPDEEFYAFARKLFGSGCGVEALGNPLSVVSWLANELAAHDREIEAGHVVSTGSFMKILPAQAGDTIEMSFANLGAIRFAIV